MILLIGLHKKKVHFMSGDSYLKATKIVEALILVRLTISDSKKSKESHYSADILTELVGPSSIVTENPSILISFIN